MMVVLFHLNASTHIRALTRNGYASVDFFFVLSGFVLMSGFGTRIGDPGAFRRFAVRRLARLYPLHLFTLAVLIGLIGLDVARNGGAMFVRPHDFPALLECLALIQGFTTDQLSWNFPSWSISIELWASLLFGLTLWLAGRRSSIVLGLYCLVLGTLLLGFGEPDGPAIDEPGALLKVDHYLLAFFAGALLFKLYERIDKARHTPPTWAEPAAAAVVMVVFLWAGDFPALATLGLFAVVILVFAFDRGPISKALQGRSFQAAGRWSYSIYLVHPFWTIAMFNAVRGAGAWSGQVASVIDGTGEHLVLGGPFAMDLAAAACLALVLATASLTYRFVERPAQRLIARSAAS